jgi:hypothetical protein
VDRSGSNVIVTWVGVWVDWTRNFRQNEVIMTEAKRALITGITGQDGSFVSPCFMVCSQ